jgi:hypothetical protein
MKNILVPQIPRKSYPLANCQLSQKKLDQTAQSMRPKEEKKQEMVILKSFKILNLSSKVPDWMKPESVNFYLFH